MSVTSQSIVDMSFLYELAENDSKYIFEVISLYLNNMPDGIAKLDELARHTNDFDAIQRQAHSLKSSAGIVKVKEMYNDLVTIETTARNEKDHNVIIPAMDNILKNFAVALPLIEAERDKNKS